MSVACCAGETSQSHWTNLLNTGDHSAWQTFYDVYRPRIKRNAKRMGIREADIPEIVQTAVTDLLAKIRKRKVDPAGRSLRGYVWGIVRFTCLDYHRQQRRFPSLAEDSHDDRRTGRIECMEDPRTSELDVRADEEFSRAVTAMLLDAIEPKTRPKDRQILDCLVFQRMSPGETAKRFSVSRREVFRARRRVLDALRKEADRLFKDGIC